MESFKTTGVCSRQIDFEVENNIIKSIIYEEWDKANDIKAIISYYKK